MKFVRSIEHRKILCGDFNLRPDTKSMSILERELKNLIKDYKITSTRSKLYTKEEKYADYILTSHDLKLINFKILDEVVSDHLPLLLEF